MTLRSLVSEGFRTRVGLSAIHALIERLPGGPHGGRPRETASQLLGAITDALALAARAIESDGAAAQALPGRVAELSVEADSLAS